MRKILGILPIIVGIVYGLNLITKIPTVINSYKTAYYSSINEDWGSFTAQIVIHLLQWIVVYILTSTGRKILNT